MISSEPLSIPEGKENTDSQGRIVIEVATPPTFNLKKKKGKKTLKKKIILKISESLEL